MDKPLRAKVAWDSHLFALRCMRRRLASAAPSEILQKQAEMVGELKEDEEAKAHENKRKNTKRLRYSDVVLKSFKFV